LEAETAGAAFDLETQELLGLADLFETRDAGGGETQCREETQSHKMEHGIYQATDISSADIKAAYPLRYRGMQVVESMWEWYFQRFPI